ncbi:hypothetical protein CPB86DRAFT_811668 [Serendipita vermifera]|nr:hypothetical protein CPB86DRAFT_811668 [Serendipita vermifera]
MSIAGQGLGAWTKGGVNKWHYRTSANTSISTFTNRASTLIAVTNKAEFLALNTSTGKIIRQVPCPPQVVVLHASHSLILSGSSDGFIRTHDFRTSTKRNSGAENMIRAHQGSVRAINSSGNWIYTIGWNIRNGRAIADPLVKIFDTRNLSSLSSFTFTAGPSLLEVHPQKSTTLVITSDAGLVNVVDVLKPDQSEFYQLSTQSYISSSSISPTGDYLSFGDAEGLIHVLSASEEDHLPFNGYEGQPVEWADTPEPLADIEWTDETPLSSIGMPYYTDYLLSSWDKDFQSVPEYYPPPMKIPPQIMTSLKKVDELSFASMPRELRGKRNVLPSLGPKRQGRFRSDRKRHQGESPPPESHEGTQRGDQIPRYYQRVEIEYSKFGIEDFDFGFYNKTPFSGLETHILNSYTNSLIQAMHYVLPIRQIAKSHITTSCNREHCLLCELGFVMRMLEDARGTNCQASNFCKTIPNIPSAGTYGVIDYVQDGREPNYGSKIQIFNRFLVENLRVEGNDPLKNPLIVSRFPDSLNNASPISQLLSIDSKSVTICSHCKKSREKADTSHIVDLIYPRKAASNESTPPSDFASILRNSLLRDYTHKAICQFCKQLTIQTTRRPLTSQELPPLLLVNASVHNDEALKFWRDTRLTRFLKPFVGLNIASEPNQPGGLVNSSVQEEHSLVWYELRSMVIDIKSPDNQSNLVSIVKVPEAEDDPKYNSSWFLFNDFTVRGISAEDALSFPGNWKVPSILYLERVDMREAVNLTNLPMRVDPSILSEDISLSSVRDKASKAHEVFGPDEMPKPGTVVAIDAEFVQMQQEETEIFNDGTRRVLRPARLGLARVSVLRGSGPKEGVPFIDDYIHTSEDIVNYLTEFSGIQPGDLNPQMSSHTLVPLKVAYKKLRLLVDLGCIFIGHGLSKDFRIINIFVPPDQVIDTVDLYFIKERQRRISLRFLTWFILKQDIQLETHDSIEDARSALLLYKAYQELEEERAFDDKLEELYRVGREHNWKPPSATKASPPQMHASPQLSYQPFFPRPNMSPTFTGAEALQLPFQAFTLDPNFRSPYVPMSEGILTPPYAPSRTPIQQMSPQSQHQHQNQGGRKGNLHNWTPR